MLDMICYVKLSEGSFLDLQVLRVRDRYGIPLAKSHYPPVIQQKEVTVHVHWYESHRI